MMVAVSVASMWLAGVEILLGVPSLVFGLRARGRAGEMQAPVGAGFLLSAAVKIFSGAVPQSILLPLIGVPFLACCVWFVLTARSSAARRAELKRKQEAELARAFRRWPIAGRR